MGVGRAAFAAVLLVVAAPAASAAMMTGGVSGVDASEPGARAAAAAALGQLDQASNSLEAQALGRVLSVKRQVVAGTRWVVECEVLRGEQTALMTLDVWEKLDQTFSLTKATTHFVVRGSAPALEKGKPELGLVGGFAMVPSNTAEVRSAALEVYRQFDDGERGEDVVVTVCKAERQVVAGFNYRLSIGADCETATPVVVYQALDGSFQITQGLHTR